MSKLALIPCSYIILMWPNLILRKQSKCPWKSTNFENFLLLFPPYFSTFEKRSIYNGKEAGLARTWRCGLTGERILSALELHSVAVKFAFKCLYCHFDLDVSRWAAVAVAEAEKTKAQGHFHLSSSSWCSNPSKV